jgi:hypothetical protein
VDRLIATIIDAVILIIPNIIVVAILDQGPLANFVSFLIGAGYAIYFWTSSGQPDLRDVCGWTLDRPPHHLETSVPGVFVAGDVRAESAKRVAAAVGEGSMAVMLVHRYLAES